MRKITDHVANPINDRIEIAAMDEPGAGGANHEYLIGCPTGGPKVATSIHFQNGPINESGINGITQEVLLAIVIDRLRSFQVGPFACEENHSALMHAEKSLDWLKQRTLSRLARGVEGTHQK